MAKIQEVAEVIQTAFGLPAEIVQGHMQGLRAAQRITSDDADPRAAADLLTACLCTDPTNATAAYHLPFIGAECSGTPIDHHSADLDAYRANTGQTLASFLSPNDLHYGCASEFTVAGRGESLRATFTAVSPELGRVRLWYGYSPVPQISAASMSLGLFESRSIGGAALRRVGRLFSASGGAHPAQRFLAAAFAANTPSERMTIH